MKIPHRTAPLDPPNTSGMATVRKSVVLTIAMLAVSVFCHAQSAPSSDTSIHLPSRPSIDSTIEEPTRPSLGTTIEVVKGDMRAERNAIVSEAMAFSDKDAAAFWPIYRKYENERSTLFDARAAVIKHYAENYPSIAEAAAKTMTERMLEYDSRDATLKKKYFKEFEKVLPSFMVAKFFQLDHRIDLLMDMKVESSLPPLDPPEQSQAQK